MVAARLLNDLERDTERALDEGYSANLVVHAFARTARAAGFGAELTEPFFAIDAHGPDATEHDAESFRRYVYGSAEVVGLMCLRIFLSDAGRDAARIHRRRARDARGGRACAGCRRSRRSTSCATSRADRESLGRSYFPGIDVADLTDIQKLALLDDIDADLALAAAHPPAAARAARAAPSRSRTACSPSSRAASGRPRHPTLVRTRVRVPDPVKLRIATRSRAGRAT